MLQGILILRIDAVAVAVAVAVASFPELLMEEVNFNKYTKSCTAKCPGAAGDLSRADIANE